MSKRKDGSGGGPLTPNDFGFRDADTKAGRYEMTEGEAISFEDFYAHMPSHRYIFQPNGELWPASSVNSRLPRIQIGEDGKGKPVTIAPSAWLDKERYVEQLVWAPGLPQLIEGRLVNQGGWIDREGARVYNTYRPPRFLGGNPADAKPWIDHVHRIYPDDAGHIIAWLAHRVQRPGEKINHALVLGGSQGIGKDTILFPVIEGIGRWNFEAISPTVLIGRFNGFNKNVILLVNEARDLGDVNRFSFYEATKPMLAAPPDTIRIDEKNLKEYSAFNCVGVIIATNHKSDGIFLPPDDRRHYVAWSDVTASELGSGYFERLYRWYGHAGVANVAAYLHHCDLGGFNPKAPPPKTQAFHEIVMANRSPNVGRFADVIDRMAALNAGRKPDAITLKMIVDRANNDPDLLDFIKRQPRSIPKAMRECDYVPVMNEDREDNFWIIGGKRVAAYALTALSNDKRIEAVKLLEKRETE